MGIKVWKFFLLFYLKGILSLKMNLSQMKDIIMNKIHKSFSGFEIFNFW